MKRVTYMITSHIWQGVWFHAPVYENLALGQSGPIRVKYGLKVEGDNSKRKRVYQECCVQRDFLT